VLQDLERIKNLEFTKGVVTQDVFFLTFNTIEDAKKIFYSKVKEYLDTLEDDETETWL